MKDYILLVEDNKIDTLVHTKIINMVRPDMEIVHMEDGKAAVDFLVKAENSPLLVLLDLIMPVMDGFGFLSSIAEMPKYQNLQVMVLTTSTNQLDKDKASAIFNIADYMVKPLSVNRFKLIADKLGI